MTPAKWRQAGWVAFIVVGAAFLWVLELTGRGVW